MSRRLVLRRTLRLLLLALLLAGSSIAPAHADPDAAGSISGRITDVVTGLPIAGATVEVANTSTPVATTDGNGSYRLVNVPEGQRYLLFEHPRYAYEYYPDAPVMMLATALTVKAGEEITGIDAALAPGGRITGRVTDKDTGAPLGGVRATARYQWYREWRVAGEGVTGEDGRYAIEGLWTSVYHVECVDEAGDHATTQYADGADVGLLTGEEVTDVDIALPHEGHIAGLVTDALTGEPFPGVTADVVGASTSDQTDSQGRYDIGSLAAGEHRLRFYRDGYAVVFYRDSPDEYQATRIPVRAGETTGGIDQALTPLGGISGRATDAETGAGLAGIDAILDPGGSETRTATGADGAYTITNVAPGAHTVILRDPSGAYRETHAKGPDGSETIIVQPGRTTEGVNAALAPVTPQPPSNRKITGMVTDVVTVEPLQDIRVALYDCYHSYHTECWDVADVLTDAAGKYAFPDPPNSEGLTFSDPTGAYMAQEAWDFRSPGVDETVVLDAALQRYDRVHGGLAGIVTAAATGEPLEGQLVCATNVYTDDYGCARTLAGGTYRIDGLKVGEYQVEFGSGNWIDDRYGRQTCYGRVTVKANEITPDVDGALPEQGRVTGAIRSATGEPLPGAAVRVCYSSMSCDTQTTAADGTYLSTYLPPYPYQVSASKAGYQQRYYRDTPDWQQAQAITVTYDSLVRGIDITLPPLGAIAGQVTDADTGAAIEGVTVTTFGWGYSAKTSADGRYVIGGLDERVYWLRLEDPNQRYVRLEKSEPVTVTLGQTSTFDAQLRPFGYISGRVTAAESGQPLGGIEVRADSIYRVGRGAITWTAPDGTYKIGPLPDDDYRVRFWDPALLRRMEYYRETTDYNGATRVTTKTGETVTGIDESMDRLAIARGRVVDADTGAPVAGVKVSGKGYYSANVPVYTDAEGRYELPGLDEGEYALTVTDRSRAYVDGQSEKVVLPLGTIVDMPDIRLKRWGEFGGTVTDGLTGEPVVGVWVQLYEHTGDSDWYNGIGGCYAITGPDGTYRIRGMYDWTVRPVFFDPQARFHAQSYGGGRSLLDAQVVTFTRGADLLGVDAKMVRVTRETRVYLPMVAR